MDSTQVVLLVVLGLLFFVSGFLSGSETAIVAIPRERIGRLSPDNRRGEHLVSLVAEIETTISTILVANNFVNILATAIATVVFTRLLGETAGPIVATFGVTIIVLVIGEITPKTLAARFPERFGLVVATPLFYLRKMLTPITAVFTAISRLALSLFRAPRASDAVTEDDVRALAWLGTQSGSIEEHEREFIDAMFAAGDRPIRDVMTPRVDVIALEVPLDELRIRQAVAETGHSRYPVTAPGASLDQLLGILYVKDLLRLAGPIGDERIRRMLRQPPVLPESVPVLAALTELRHRRAGFAMVADEHGGIEGLVTIKDLVSELVGELQDEYDPRVPSAVRSPDGSWVADGRITVEELQDLIGIELPTGPYSSVAGLFLTESGDIPREGDIITVDSVTMTVTAMEKLRIARIRVDKLAAE